MVIKTLKIDKSKSRDTGMAMVLICLILFFWLDQDLYIILATGLLVLTMTAPGIFKPLGYLWFGFAHILGTIVSRIILFLVFYVLVAPVGVFRRMVGKDPMKRKQWKKGSESVFTSRDHTFLKEDITKPY